MFAKDAPFHFILASHLQPVNQVDDPIILNKIRYKMNLGAVAWLVFFGIAGSKPGKCDLELDGALCVSRQSGLVWTG
jgi:hypothetical protein